MNKGFGTPPDKQLDYILKLLPDLKAYLGFAE